MKFLGLSKLNKKCSKWTVLALTIGFSLTVLFGSPLHDHDLDPLHLDPDCIPCHLVHSNDALNTDTAELFPPTLGASWIRATYSTGIASARLTAFSRDPPIAC